MESVLVEGGSLGVPCRRLSEDQIGFTSILGRTRLGGTLQTGRVLDYGGKGDDERTLCSMYLGIMDRMGVELDRFGDADERLAGF